MLLRLFETLIFVIAPTMVTMIFIILSAIGYEIPAMAVCPIFVVTYIIAAPVILVVHIIATQPVLDV